MERGLSQRLLHHHSGRSAHPPCRRDRPRRQKLSPARERTGGRPTEEEKMTSTNNVPNRQDYVAKVLQWFVELPDTPCRSRQPDLIRAAELHSRGIGLNTAECAMLLGSLRRLGRPPGDPPLQPIRS